jgi:hypothetical protein
MKNNLVFRSMFVLSATVLSSFGMYSIAKNLNIAHAATPCIVTIFGVQYDVEPLKTNHTGGDVFICNTDMTAVYQGMHGTNVSRMASFLVTTPAPSPSTTPSPSPSTSPSPSATPLPSVTPSPSATPIPSASPRTESHHDDEHEEDEDHAQRHDSDDDDDDEDEDDHKSGHDSDKVRKETRSNSESKHDRDDD